MSMKRRILIVSLLAAIVFLFSSAFADQRPCVKVNVGNPFYTGTITNDAQIGVIGCVSSTKTNQILKVYPESDLNRFGIEPGDFIIGVHFIFGVVGADSQRLLRGPVGSKVLVNFSKANGRVFSGWVERRDVRIFLKYSEDDINHYYKRLEESQDNE
jgi:C-terminal processing protease CtpA/Prc